MIILYEGVDITNLVSVGKCVHDMRDYGKLPSLHVEFDDTEKLWDSWGPKSGDRIEIKGTGAASTGAMFVHHVEPMAGKYALRANALKCEDERMTRSWASTTMMSIASQIAASLDVGIEFHGVDDMRLLAFEQSNEESLRALARLCSICGCNFDLYNETIHVYGISWLESQTPCGKLTVTTESAFRCRKSQKFGACSIEQKEISGKRLHMEASATIGDGPTIRHEMCSSVSVDGTSELERMCHGILAYENARCVIGSAKGSELSPFTTGSVIEVEFSTAPSMSGKSIVTRVRNDYASGESKVFWRPLT